MKYIVEDWNTEEVIAIFDTENDRNTWIAQNVNDDGYTNDGRRVSIYEA